MSAPDQTPAPSRPVLERLKQRADFLRLAEGRRMVMPGLILQMAPTPEGAAKPLAIRLGFTVTKKIGNAVTRNRVKRRLRAAAAQVMAEIGQPGHDYVLVGREGSLTRIYSDLLADLTEALAKIARAKPAGPFRGKRR